MSAPNLTVGEVAEINHVVDSVYQNVKAQYFMAIFSPDNVATILFLGLSSDVSPAFRTRFFNVFSRYAAYAEIANMIDTRTWVVNGVPVVFNGYTTHGVIAYGLSKGFTLSLIRQILLNLSKLFLIRRVGMVLNLPLNIIIGEL